VFSVALTEPRSLSPDKYYGQGRRGGEKRREMKTIEWERDEDYRMGER
jgi:hypothetical protein